MKKIHKYLFALLFVAFFTFSTASLSMAQNTTSLGLKAGLNLANFRGEDVEDAENRTAFNIGALVNYSVAEKVGLSFELDYSSQGAKSGDGNAETTTKLDYLRGTLLFNYYFGTGDMDIRPELFAGPYYGFLLSAQSKTGDGDYNDFPDGVYTSGDFGAAFGAGLHLRISEGIWLVPDVRYNIGITDIVESDATSARNGVLSVNIGVTFPLN